MLNSNSRINQWLLSATLLLSGTGCHADILKNMNQLTALLRPAAANRPRIQPRTGTGQPVPARAPVALESLKTLAESDWVTLEGQIQLPPIHQRNLFGRQMLGSNQHAHLMDSSASAPEAHQHPHELRKSSYQRVQPETIPLKRYLKVSAVPIRVAGTLPDQWLRVDTEAELVQLDAELYEGTLDDRGHFSIQVPAYAPGYLIAVDGGKVHLKARVPRPSAQNPIVVNLKSTLLADLSLLGPETLQTLSDTELAERFPQLSQQEASLESSYADRLGFNQSRRLAKKMLRQSAFKTSLFMGCTGTSPDPICYDDSTDRVYNLMAADDISDFASSFYTVDFNAATGKILKNQYSNGSTGVIFTGGSLRPRRTRIQEKSGWALATPADSKGGRVRIHFESNNVHAVGLTLQNGNSHSTSGSTATATRRAFRLIARDSGGAIIRSYNWYTSQTGLGFYGLTSPDPIGSLEIRVSGADAFSLGNLIYTDDYLADTVSADASGNSLRANLGWRATGGFSKQTTGSTSTTFSHPYVSGSSGMRSGGSGYSEGPYWHVPYGSSESTLVAPAFTLSHLPMLQTKDQNTSKWYIGSAIDNRKGYTDSLVSKLRIPNNSERAGTGSTVTMSAAAAAVSTTTLIILPAGEGAKFVNNGPIQISGGAFPSPITRLVQRVSGDQLTLFEALPAALTGTESIYAYPTYAQSLADTDFHYHESTAAMHTHWSHVHWQAYLGVEDAAQYENVSGSTERYVEYSTDNGQTWRNAYWFKDLNHHGANGVWWNNHMHPFPDSDLNETDFDANGTLATDFDKDGTSEYSATIDNNHDDQIDSNDQREWDTEFYMEYVPLDASATGDTHPYNSAVQVVSSEIEGTSIVYRFRFVGPTTPASCSASGVPISCEGWKLDDVAFNNDDPEVGYYTNFEGAFDSNLD